MIATLTSSFLTGIQDNPAVPESVKSQAQTKLGAGIPFISDKDLQAKYKAHIASILKLANIADPDTKAARIYDLENKIANVHATREESGDVHKANNPWRTADLPRLAPGLDWNDYLSAAGLQSQPVIVAAFP